MEMIAAGAVAGKALSLLVDEVLERVKLLAKGDKRFRVLQKLLSRLQEPVDYLVNHDDKAGETPVHQLWLKDFRKEFAEAESLVTNWPKIRRWDLRGRYNALKRLIHITENLERLDNSQTVSLASNVRNFGRLGEGVDRVGAGVDRLGEEVKVCVEHLISEVRSLTVEREEIVQATQDALANGDRVAFPEKLAELKTRVLGTSGSRADHEIGSRPHQSWETVTHLSSQDSFPDEVFGGNKVLETVIAEILRDDHPKCIGLWSMGGAGKTFTAGRVFHDSRIQRCFEGNRIWVTVAKRDSYSVMKEIFVKAGGTEAHFPAGDDKYGVKSALKRRLNLDEYLLVIDDVWEAAQLDFIDLIPGPEDSKRRVVLVTTRRKDLLDRKHATKIEVSLLSEDDSCKLFSRNAFGHAPVPSKLRDVSRSVAAECKGLPLALKVIGSTLGGETNSQVWENSLKKLKHATILSKEHEVQVFGRLQLSVDNLRDRDEGDSRLQHGFYYFAAYPEDEEISAGGLVDLWTADGIVGKDPEPPISPTSEAYEILGTLISLSMIDIVKFEEYTVKIHDVMRDLARYNLENNFGQGLSKTEKIPACDRLCLYRPGLQMQTFPKDWTIAHGAEAITWTTLSVERLSLSRNMLQQLPEQFDAPRLRVLLLDRNPTLKSIPARLFECFRSLRILDLGSTGIEEVPEAISNLISLVKLQLGSCLDLRKIPASIEHLQNLQELAIGNCQRLRCVPKTLRNLTSLEALRATQTFIWDGPESASENEGPKSLSEGDGDKSSSKDNATLEDLVVLISLQSISLTIISAPSSVLSGIGQLTALQSVRLSCQSWTELPEDFTKLVNLTSLDLVCTFCTRLPTLDVLQHLTYLSVCSDRLESLPDSFGRSGAFPSLQTFKVDGSRLKGFIPQPGAMPQVKSFIISSAEKMEFPASFRALSSLTYLKAEFCQSLENLSAFEEPNSFPYLEEIDFSDSTILQSLPGGMLKSAPKLRRINLTETGVSRSDIPKDLLEKERLKQLEIAMYCSDV